jgi:hypothetical protein
MRSLSGAVVNRLGILLVVAALGWTFAHSASLGDPVHSHGYLYAATALLAVGLYSSTYGIDRVEVRTDAKMVLLAVTLGVFAKAILITGAVYLIFRRPEYLVLGVAVAQIDPLSVAAMQARSQMSARAKALLLAWASFDDPVTMLLTVYLSGFTLSMLGRSSTGGLTSDGAVSTLVSDLGGNLLFAGCAFAVWWLLCGRKGRRDSSMRRVIEMVLLSLLMAFAVWHFLMLGLAIVGLFIRPDFGKYLEKATRAAFFCAVFALGLLLTGVDLLPGLALGVAAFGAQFVIAQVIARRHTANDRGYLALGQQNGITAVILALLLQPDFPQTIGIVAPAILVVNVLHIAGNAYWDARVTRSTPLGTDAPAGKTAPAQVGVSSESNIAA